MTTKPIKFINLDEVDPVVDFTFRFKGVDYKLAAATVSSFIANNRLIRDLEKNPTLEKQLELTMDMLIMAFPGLTQEILKEMSLPQMNKLISIAHENNGQSESLEDLASEVIKEGAQKEQANPPAAGQ